MGDIETIERIENKINLLCKKIANSESEKIINGECIEYGFNCAKAAFMVAMSIAKVAEEI